MQAIDELAQIARQRTWDKELLLWSGPEAKLLPALKGLQIETLDLLDLFDPTHPTWTGLSETGCASRRDAATWDDDDVRHHLSRSLRRQLQAVDRTAGKRTALVVRSAGLLARYRVGVRDFYEWFCDDFSMVILLVERPAVEEDWPEEVDGDPDRLVEYFAEAGMTKRQFGT
jgi:hypothetical protein